MMIARNWKKSSVTVEGRQHPSLHATPSRTKSSLPEKVRRFLPSRRDREVPYGMKGGECDARKESCIKVQVFFEKIIIQS